MVVVACGIRPRVDVAKRSKIPVSKGILVNDTLATQVPGVYAIGECTEHAGVTYGLVAPASEQATVLAAVLTGNQSRYRGSSLYARLKVAGVEVASFGVLVPRSDRARRRSWRYRRAVMPHSVPEVRARESGGGRALAGLLSVAGAAVAALPFVCGGGGASSWVHAAGISSRRTQTRRCAATARWSGRAAHSRAPRARAGSAPRRLVTR